MTDKTSVQSPDTDPFVLAFREWLETKEGKDAMIWCTQGNDAARVSLWEAWENGRQFGEVKAFEKEIQEQLAVSNSSNEGIESSRMNKVACWGMVWTILAFLARSMDLPASCFIFALFAASCFIIVIIEWFGPRTISK